MAKEANIAARASLDGEAEFKQAIRGINSDMKVMASEMKKVTSEFVDNDKSVAALTARDKILREEQTLQVKKLAEVQQALMHSKEAYGDTDERTKKWQITLNNTQADLNGMNRKMDENKAAIIAAQNPTEALSKDVKTFGDNADKAGGHALKMGDIIKANLISGAIISGVKALASALVGVAKQTYDIVLDTIDLTGEISDNSQKVGMSAEEYQKWKYAASQAGLEQEILNSMMEKQQTTFTKATAETKKSTLSLAEQKRVSLDLEKAKSVLNKAINKYGKNSLEARDAANKLKLLQEKSVAPMGELSKAYKDLGVEIKGLTSSQAFEKVIKSLAEMKDENEQNRLANILFGKSFADIKPFLAEGADGIDALRQKAVDLGGVMSNESVAAGEKLGDTIDDLKFMFSGVANEIITSFMPELQKMADWVLANKDEIKKFGTEVIGNIASGFKWFADNRENIEKAFAGILKGLTGFSDNKELIVVAVLGIAGAFTAAAIAAGAFQSAWSIGINAAFIVTGIYAIAAAIDAVTGKASKRPNVTKATLGTTGTQSGRGNASLGTGTQPTGGSVTQTGYSRHDAGGVFMNPTLFRTPGGYHEVAEKRPEVIMPLKMIPSLLGLDRQPQITVPMLKEVFMGMRIEMGDDGFGRFVDSYMAKAMAKQ